MNTFITIIAFSAVFCVTFANPSGWINKGFNKDTLKVIKAPTLPAAVDAWPSKVSGQQIGPNIQVNGAVQQAGWGGQWGGQWGGAWPINAGLINPIAVGEPYPCPFAGGNGWYNNGYGLTGWSAGWGNPALGNGGVVVEKLAPKVLSVAAPAQATLPIKTWAAPNVISKAKY